MASNLIVRGGADFSGMNKGLKDAQKKIKGFQQNTKQSLSKVQGSFGTMKSGFLNAFKGLAVASGAVMGTMAMIGFGKQAVETASNLIEVQNVVDTVFGDMRNQINDFSNTAIEQFGLSELSAKKFSSTFGAMLKSMGLSGNELTNMSLGLTGLAGDIASFYNLQPEEAFEKLQSGIAGETKPLRELGINMNIVNLEAFAMEKGIKKSWNAMSLSEQTLLRYNYILDKTQDAQGDFIKTSDSWANQTKILSERWKQFSGVIGGLFIRALTPVLNMLNSMVDYLIDFSNKFTEVMNGLFGKPKEQQSQTKGVVDQSAAYTDLGDSVEEAGKKSKKALAGFDEINQLDMGEDNTALLTQADAGSKDTQKEANSEPTLKAKLANLASLMAKFSPAITVWGDAFGSLKEAIIKAFEGIKGSVSGLWKNTLAPFAGYVIGDWIPSMVNGWSNTFAPIFKDVMPVVFSEFTKDFDFACQQIDKITKDVFQPTMDFMKDVSLDVFDGIGKAWDEHGKGILDKFTIFKEALRGIWDSLYDNVFKPVFSYIGDTVSWLWDKHLKPLWDNISDFVGSLIEYILMVWGQYLAPLFQFLIERFGPTLAFVFEIIVDVIGTVIAVIADVIGGIFKALGGLLDFLTGVFTGDWKKAWEGIKQFFGGIFDAIWGIVKGAINLIIDGLNLLWGAIYMTVKAVVDSIGGIAGAIGKLFGQDWKFSMPAEAPKIPKLAKGGIVSSPTLATIGEAGAEAVMPLENNTGWMDKLGTVVANAVLAAGGTGGQSQNISLRVDVGDKNFVDLVLDSIRAEERRTGRRYLVSGG